MLANEFACRRKKPIHTMQFFVVTSLQIQLKYDFKFKPIDGD